MDWRLLDEENIAYVGYPLYVSLLVDHLNFVSSILKFFRFSLQTSIVGELAGGGSVAVVVDISKVDT